MKVHYLVLALLFLSNQSFGDTVNLWCNGKGLDGTEHSIPVVIDKTKMVMEARWGAVLLVSDEYLSLIHI